MVQCSKATLMEFLSLSKTYSSPAFKQSLCLCCWSDWSDWSDWWYFNFPEICCHNLSLKQTRQTSSLVFYFSPLTFLIKTNIFKLKVDEICPLSPHTHSINSRLPESFKFNVKKENKSCHDITWHNMTWHDMTLCFVWMRRLSDVRNLIFFSDYLPLQSSGCFSSTNKNITRRDGQTFYD